MTTTRQMVSTMRIFTSSGTWFKPANLVHIHLIIRSAGGGGTASPTAGGGGGAAVASPRISHTALPDQVAVTVGAGGQLGTDGGSSGFLEYIVPGGRGGSHGGQGGLAPGGAGGNGGTSSTLAQAAVGAPISLLTGGGGGAGGMAPSGGSAGLVPNGSAPSFPYTSQSGPGGNAGQPGKFPGGGGGYSASAASSAGGAGCVTVVEVTYTEVEA